jgi:glyoxylase-like metal-dependent hydrolase (beta-lactamase superfamily II)
MNAGARRLGAAARGCGVARVAMVAWLLCLVPVPGSTAATAAATPDPAAPTPPRTPPRVFLPIKGDLWRAGNGNWWSLVYVTPDGIVLVDPISPDFAAWLKRELGARFPGKAVKYIVYSHSHWDHVGGAAVFADSHPHIVGQERILKNMDGRYPHMPGDMVDRNNNGTIEAEEIDIPTREHFGICGMFPGYFATIDRNHSGHLTPAQWWAAQGVVPPDIVYSERMTLVFGGRHIELVFPGLNHADDGTVVYFPLERVVFSADFPAGLARSRASLGPADCSHLSASASSAEELIVTVGLESRDNQSGRHVELLQDLSRARIDSPQFCLLAFPGGVPELSVEPGDPGDEAVGFDRAQNRAGFGIDLMDLAVPILSDPECSLSPREPRVAAAARRRDRGQHPAGVRIDLLDAILGELKQVLAVEGRSGVRGDVDRAQHFAALGIEGIQLFSSGKPDLLAVVRDSSHALGTREGAVLADDFGG